MKRVHSYSNNLAELEYFGINHAIDYPVAAFQDYYPHRLRLKMMRDALACLPLSPMRRLRIQRLLNHTAMTNKQKFDAFVKMMTPQELNCIGW